MDTEEAFKNITECIKNGKYELVRPQLDAIMDSDDDIHTMMKCASILKTIDDEKGCQQIIDSVLSKVTDDENERFDVALSVRSLGRAEDALDLMDGLESDESRIPEIARTMHAVGKGKEALSLLDKCKDLSIKDRILRCDILCSLGSYPEAQKEAETILGEEESYRTMVNYISVLMRSEKVKEATKYAKSHLKQDKKNVDSLALEAYVMWINGKIPAAANYANRALQMDYSHTGALETMAMCLISKQKYPQAKLLAGVINEKDPADPAVMRILDACRLSA